MMNNDKIEKIYDKINDIYYSIRNSRLEKTRILISGSLLGVGLTLLVQSIHNIVVEWINFYFTQLVILVIASLIIFYSAILYWFSSHNIEGTIYSYSFKKTSRKNISNLLKKDISSVFPKHEIKQIYFNKKRESVYFEIFKRKINVITLNKPKIVLKLKKGNIIMKIPLSKDTEELKEKAYSYFSELRDKKIIKNLELTSKY